MVNIIKQEVRDVGYEAIRRNCIRGQIKKCRKLISEECENMNVIFWDFNGVLDTYENIDKINKENLQRLKYIVDETNAKVVISSFLKNSYYYTGYFS